ncbi:MAG: efflux RND transporter permease subunit [Phycisphaeraceae bacterium]|nr:efflux RND transporter permease subunit [Phycisphaeraceae bacterium]
MSDSQNHGLLSRIVELFLKSNLSVMLIVLSLIAGAVALWITPREEEPQIVVPLADVMVSVPGASAQEVERQIATRLEKLLYQIDGVEYVYSMSQDDGAIVTVRFYVGEDREDSLIKLYNKLSMNADEVPASVAGWVVKPIEIDDVPIVGITLHSTRYDGAALRRMAEELDNRLQAVANTGRTYVIGGQAQQVTVMLDPQRMAGRDVTVQHITQALQAANVNMPAGTFQRLDEDQLVEAGVTFRSVGEVADLVVSVFDGRPVYLREVADIELGAAEVDSYTQLYLPGEAQPEHAVTVAVAKKKGANAVWVSRAVQAEVEKLAPMLFPDGVEWRVTRDYGRTADDKVNELVEALAVAIIIVIALIVLTLGWREALIVAVAVPITFALTLLVNELAGYTINRVTLFALILALGLVVDDPIVDVENIYRHFKMRLQPPLDAVLTAVNEVRPPIIYATLAVIISFIPMFFITGMMGPYMRPMALNVPLAMLMSMVVAFTITPWMSYYVLRGEYGKTEQQKHEYDLHSTRIYRLYAAITRPMMERRALAWAFIGLVVLLFAGACLLVVTRSVPLKMLPYDNKNEFTVVIDMPEGDTLEHTAAASDALARRVLELAGEVTDITSYVGTSGPMDFNGMVRHYYLRRGANVGELRVNLVGKHDRAMQSHQITLRLRNDLDVVARKFGANIKLVEAPPGPPVIATLTVEVYGQPYNDYAQIQAAARIVEQRLAKEPGVVDVDSSIEAEQPRWVFVTDKEKAALSGYNTQEVAQTIATAVAGSDVSVLHSPHDANPTPIHLQAPLTQRDPQNLEQLYVGSTQLAEIGRFEQIPRNQTIYHKNLRPVAYVFAEMAGRPPADAILDMHSDLTPGNGHIASDFEVRWAGEGEWKITVDVFRDLGIAFGVACLGIYMLLVYETASYFMPLVLMISIPLTIIGIMPGFALLNLISNRPIGGYADPVFFTATAMIGMIALSGIAVRNAILLIDFIHAAQRAGKPLRDAILESGAVRFRPIFLTAGAAMLAAAPITLDPIFSGLAWALIFGLFVSTAFTLLLIPVVYWLIYGGGEKPQISQIPQI